MITLRPDQTDTIERTRAAYRRNRAVLMQASCGFGKTYCAAEIARRALNKGTVTLTVPRLALVDQTEQSMCDMGVRGVRIDMVQTAVRRPIETDFLIADEAHYHFSPAWRVRLQDYLLRGGKILGLTASPVAGMDAVYGDMVCGPTPKWLMSQGHLSDYRAFGPSSPDLSKIPIRHGEYATDPLAEMMSKPSITGDAVSTWGKRGGGARTIAYCVSREASKTLVRHFLAQGISAEHIDGDTPADGRRAMAVRFANRETRVLSNVGLFQLGYDLSSQVGRDVPIEAMIDMAPTRSVQMQTQKWGRTIRKKPDPALIFDHAGNIRDLQMLPDSDVDWSIASGAVRKAGEAALAITICHACFAAYRTAPACPYCHAERKLSPREVEKIDGELAEIERERIGRQKKVEVAIASRSETPLQALAAVAKDRGYKVGWVMHRLKLKGITVQYSDVVRAMK